MDDFSDTIQRFSGRVENYSKFRPRYPLEVLDCLRAECQLTTASVIADIGSGTGILSEMFLRNGNLVFGVEPNSEMREAGERMLRPYANFRSVAGTAESTTLGDDAIDFVTAGQSFHWFDPSRAADEFRRILRNQGWVVLIWNDRRKGSLFSEDYERLLRTYGTDYERVSFERVDDQALHQFFGTGFAFRSFEDNVQTFDWEGLKGRLLSSSYAPQAGHPDYARMLLGLREIFEAHESGGRLDFRYETKLYFGRLQ